MFLHVCKNPPLTKEQFDPKHIQWDNDYSVSLYGALYLSTLFTKDTKTVTSNWIEHVIKKNGVYEQRDFDPVIDNPYDSKLEQAHQKYEEVKIDPNINEACRQNNLKQIGEKLARLNRRRKEYIEHYSKTPYEYSLTYWKNEPIRLIKTMDEYKWVSYKLSDQAKILYINHDNSFESRCYTAPTRPAVGSVTGEGGPVRAMRESEFLDKYCKVSSDVDGSYLEKIFYDIIRDNGYDGIHLAIDLFVTDASFGHTLASRESETNTSIDKSDIIFSYFGSEQLIIWNWCFDETQILPCS